MEDTNKEIVPKKKSLLNTFLKVVLPLALGIVILYFLFKDINFNDVWDILKDANWGILLFSLLFGLAGHTLRGYRWKLFIDPLGYPSKVSILSYAIYGGYAVNFALPRAGEIWKCGIVAKEEKIPFSKLLGTVVLDRIFDSLTVLFICLIAFLFNMQFFISQLKHNQETFDAVVSMLQSPILYIVVGSGLITLFVIFKFFRENFIVKKVSGFLAEMVRDMKAIWRMKTKWQLIISTIGIWVSYFLYFYVTFFAFDFTANLGFTAGLIAFALSSLSMGVPSNGGIGPWQAAVVAGLTLYNVDSLHSLAFATGVFGIQSIWVILLGLFGMAMLALNKKK